MATYIEQFGVDDLYVDNANRGTIWDIADTIWDSGNTTWDLFLINPTYTEQIGNTVIYT